MIDRDAPVDALDTSPSYRHRLHHAAPIYALNQSLIGWPRLRHNNASPEPSSAVTRVTSARSWASLRWPQTNGTAADAWNAANADLVRQALA